MSNSVNIGAMVETSSSRMDVSLNRLQSAVEALESAVTRVEDRTYPVRRDAEKTDTQACDGAPVEITSLVVRRVDDVSDMLDLLRYRLDANLDLLDI